MTMDGQKTNVEWKANHVVFPTIEGSSYSGVAIAYYGLDSAIRGVVINGVRPDFVLIDDPETRESAASPHQIATRESAIDRDIAGLAGPRKRIARVMLCTIQNRYCIAFKYTDQSIKPSWSGRRFKMLTSWPDNRELMDEYIVRRGLDMQGGDKHARSATQFYLDNRAAIEAGATVANPERFDPTVLPDGWVVEPGGAIQHCFNIICDTSLEAFLSECQNNPPADSGPEGSGLTSNAVARSQNRWPRRKLPNEPMHCVTAAIDLGKYSCHWTVIGWLPDATGLVLDYGDARVAGMGTKTPQRAAELALYETLMSWRNEMLSLERPPELVLVDSGDFTQTAYQFVRDVGKPFFLAKGSGSSQFRHGTASATRIIGENWYASHLASDGVWLYHLNTDHWKDYVHQRFLTPTVDEVGNLRPASLSLYNSLNDRKLHVGFANHIVAEERREEFVPGKGLKRWWHQINRNNHWLDATYMACAAGNMLGVKLPMGGQGSKSIEAAMRPKSKPRSVRNVLGATSRTGEPYFINDRRE